MERRLTRILMNGMEAAIHEVKRKSANLVFSVLIFPKNMAAGFDDMHMRKAVGLEMGRSSADGQRRFTLPC